MLMSLIVFVTLAGEYSRNRLTSAKVGWLFYHIRLESDRISDLITYGCDEIVGLQFVLALCINVVMSLWCGSVPDCVIPLLMT